MCTELFSWFFFAKTKGEKKLLSHPNASSIFAFRKVIESHIFTYKILTNQFNQ